VGGGGHTSSKRPLHKQNCTGWSRCTRSAGRGGDTSSAGWGRDTSGAGRGRDTSKTAQAGAGDHAARAGAGHGAWGTGCVAGPHQVQHVQNGRLVQVHEGHEVVHVRGLRIRLVVAQLHHSGVGGVGNVRGTNGAARRAVVGDGGGHTTQPRAGAATQQRALDNGGGAVTAQPAAGHPLRSCRAWAAPGASARQRGAYFNRGTRPGAKARGHAAAQRARQAQPVWLALAQHDARRGKAQQGLRIRAVGRKRSAQGGRQRARMLPQLGRYTLRQRHQWQPGPSQNVRPPRHTSPSRCLLAPPRPPTCCLQSGVQCPAAKGEGWRRGWGRECRLWPNTDAQGETHAAAAAHAATPQRRNASPSLVSGTQLIDCAGRGWAARTASVGTTAGWPTRVTPCTSTHRGDHLGAYPHLHRLWDPYPHADIPARTCHGVPHNDAAYTH
jgi:hypothetical protein